MRDIDYIQKCWDEYRKSITEPILKKCKELDDKLDLILKEVKKS